MTTARFLDPQRKAGGDPPDHEDEPDPPDGVERVGHHHLNARVYAGFRVGLVKQIDRREKMPSVRRLTAILAADVAGYSRLMGADEEGTHERLKSLRRE